MNRRTGVLGLVFAVLAGCVLAGCVSPQARLQMAEDAEAKKDLSIRTIGDIAEIGAYNPIQASGIGLVTGLDGTGGTPDTPYRKQLEQHLRKQRIEHVKEILDSPDNALVLVTTFIKPGARVGDRFDVEIWLPPGSKATSLAGGTLQLCTLRDHQSSKALVPESVGSDHALQGHILAHARGPLIVGLGEGTTTEERKKALVWRGAASHIDFPYWLALRKDSSSSRALNAVAERLNFLFQQDPQRLAKMSQQTQLMFQLDDVAQQINHKVSGSADTHTAKAKPDHVELTVPYNYRLNPERFAYVTRMVPLADDADQLVRYKRRIQKLLVDPAEAIMAARRLEALGRDSLPPLRQGLTSEHPLVRFACAEALAYLADPSGTEELGQLAAHHPLLASGCVIALASLDEPGSRRRLNEMLSEGDPALRSTAFAMLRELAEHDSPEAGVKTPWGGPYREYLVRNLGGEQLNGSFWLHRVAPRSSRMVCFAADTRAEVVLFGEGIALNGSVRTLAGPAEEFVLTYESGSDKCVVSRISRQLGRRQTLCPPTLEDIIRAMAALGAEYSDVVDLLRKLDERQCLNCAARLNTAMPEVTLQMLVAAQRDGTLLRDDSGEAERRILSAAAC
jgi:hypothetical protein